MTANRCIANHAFDSPSATLFEKQWRVRICRSQSMMTEKRNQHRLHITDYAGLIAVSPH
jgi:hypothetical protein